MSDETNSQHNTHKILILGSGGLSIGQAGEFDYSGSQAIKAMKEEGKEVILINPNIATIQTSKELADQVYFVPVTPDFVEKVIKQEKPQGILLAFGGQTALNCGVELWKNKVLEQHNVQVLGTPVESIIATEDRDEFVQKLNQIHVKTARSKAVKNVEGAVQAAQQIGFPIIIRSAYALGGLGSAFCNNEEELKKAATQAFSIAQQILVEESLKGWKEVEYEVVRDCKDNCITVCNMENFDPLGIHTGESIVVAPSQTLNNDEYHKLREISIKVIKHLGIIGECNIQFALDPESEDYRVIEVNARLSRSSALASKATGYPLAFVAAKLALGYALTDIENKITKTTCACFEPALDYVVVKVPKWDLAKFKQVSPKIGSSMKSVGEVMSIGRSFEEALQKALRMLDNGFLGVVGSEHKISQEHLQEELVNPSDKRVYALGLALLCGNSINTLYQLTKIDKWFLYKIKHIVDVYVQLQTHNITTLPKELLHEAKKKGFSDVQIAKQLKLTGSMYEQVMQVRRLRKNQGIVPVVKQIDTLAAEYPAQTNYLYLTYHGTTHDIHPQDQGVVVLGSGAYRIGSSVEFDWCCVNAVLTLKKLGHPTIMINYNPETVSTDYDICDRLYFEELSFERVLDIYDVEHPQGIILSMGGQIPNNLALSLQKENIPVLGTTARCIDKAEDRNKFSALLDTLKIDQPEWKELTTPDAAKSFANSVGFPVLVRPSYVLSGAAMNVAYNEKDLDEYLQKAVDVSTEHPVVMSKFILGAKEIEMDAVANTGKVIHFALSEHVENAGVHSGDATLVFPAQKLYLETARRVKQITKKIAQALEITGPFNIQFLAKGNDVKVIECNLRASRSFPFVSKVSNLNLIELATKAIMGCAVQETNAFSIDIHYVGVKAPQFSFTRLQGADPLLGVEMASTGEVACLGEDVHEAYLKSLLSVGYTIPKKNILLSTGPIESKARFLKAVRALSDMNYVLYATQGTANFLRENNMNSTVLHWPLEERSPNVIEYIEQGKIDLVINIPKSNEEIELQNDYLIRRKTVDFSIPLLTDLKGALLFVESLQKKRATQNLEELHVKPWSAYES